MMSEAYPLLIRTTLWDAGCLPELLRREIQKLGRWRTEYGDDFSEYLAQLRAVLAAVEAARSEVTR